MFRQVTEQSQDRWRPEEAVVQGEDQPPPGHRHHLLRAVRHRGLRGKRLAGRLPGEAAGAGSTAYRRGDEKQLVETAGIFLAGLSPATTYHYRFVTQNGAAGPVYGEGYRARVLDPDCGQGATFTTFPAAPFTSKRTAPTSPSGSASRRRCHISLCFLKGFLVEEVLAAT